MVRFELGTPGLQTLWSTHWAIQLNLLLMGESDFIQLVYCIIKYPQFLHCDWLLAREVQWFYWAQELLIPVEKFTVRMTMVRLELAIPGLQIQCSRHWAIQLNLLLLGRSWVYPVGVLHNDMFPISQLWLTSGPRNAVVLLDTRTTGTSREIYSKDSRGKNSNSQTLDYKPIALAIGLYSSICLCWDRKELSLSSLCIASLYIHNFSTEIDFSSEKYPGSTKHRNSWYQ